MKRLYFIVLLILSSCTNEDLIVQSKTERIQTFCKEAKLLKIGDNAIEPDYKLYVSNNSPNPFDTITRISFTIPYTMSTKILLYDAFKESKQIVLDRKLEKGAYQIEINFEELESGTYFYCFEFPNKLIAKPMFCIKE